MKIHHLNYASLCLPKAPFSKKPLAHLVCHGLLVEGQKGLILLDTGLGRSSLGAYLGLMEQFGRQWLEHLSLKPSSAREEVIRLGFKPKDIQHILLTHLDFDHAGGIEDFPNAKVHLLKKEWSAHERPNSLKEKQRYALCRAQKTSQWQLYDHFGESWFGFEAVRDLKGLPPEILMIPLAGHSFGHAGYAIKTSESGWIFHVGDAYFHQNQAKIRQPSCPYLLEKYQRSLAWDERSWEYNIERIRNLKKNRKKQDTLEVFCAHDPSELERYAP
jgi:glyoxylase-like metal-dependent hydrolase (beta-lactamase superfamily II)